MTKSCEFCGHPGPFVPRDIPEPDPRTGIVITCTVCKHDITYATHQWLHGPDGRWVCCACMSTTKGIRDMTHSAKPWISEPGETEKYVEWLETLNDNQRLYNFGLIKGSFCIECGATVPDGLCTCTRDD